MGQLLHGSATTIEAVRRAIQHIQASLRTLARRHGTNPKTVAKWRKRTSTADMPTWPGEAKSTVLTIEQEAVIVAFRRQTLLPLDDCLYALQASIPNLTRAPLPVTSRHLTSASNRGRESREVTVYNFARRLKTLKGLTPYATICRTWAREPARLHLRSDPPIAGTKHLEVRIG